MLKKTELEKEWQTDLQEKQQEDPCLDGLIRNEYWVGLEHSVTVE